MEAFLLGIAVASFAALVVTVIGSRTSHGPHPLQPSYPPQLPQPEAYAAAQEARPRSGIGWMMVALVIGVFILVSQFPALR